MDGHERGKCHARNCHVELSVAVEISGSKEYSQRRGGISQILKDHPIVGQHEVLLAKRMVKILAFMKEQHHVHEGPIGAKAHFSVFVHSVAPTHDPPPTDAATGAIAETPVAGMTPMTASGTYFSLTSGGWTMSHTFPRLLRKRLS